MDNVEHIPRVYPFSQEVQHSLDDHVIGHCEERTFSCTRQNKVPFSLFFIYVIVNNAKLQRTLLAYNRSGTW